MNKIVLILHNIRSTYNVGAIVRSAECFGVSQIFATGYSPYTFSDIRIDPPHVTNKMRNSIHKSALGTEETLPVIKKPDVNELIYHLRNEGYKIVALEQNDESIPINNYDLNKPIALLLGEEVHGITENLLVISDEIIEIPMLGKKESLNVSVAASIALYELRRNILIEQ